MKFTVDLWRPVLVQIWLAHTHVMQNNYDLYIEAQGDHNRLRKRFDPFMARPLFANKLSFALVLTNSCLQWKNSLSLPRMSPP
jgi:hypothetical protein